MTNTIGERIHRVSVYYAMFLLLSFFGWILEEVYFFATGRGVCDRGFLAFPICPVYGISLVLVYFFFGTPQKMRFFGYQFKRNVALIWKIGQAALYLVLGGIVCTASELLVGILLDSLFGIAMWDYGGMRFQVGGYICFSFALIWGFLTLIFMRLFFVPLLRRLYKIRREVLYAVLIPLTVFLLMDFSINSTYSFVKREHMDLW